MKVIVALFWMAPFIVRIFYNADAIEHGLGFTREEWKRFERQARLATEAEANLKLICALLMAGYIFSGVAVTVITLLIMAAYLAVSYMGGVARQSFRDWAEKNASEPNKAQWPPAAWPYRWFNHPFYMAKFLEYLFFLAMVGGDIVCLLQVSSPQSLAFPYYLYLFGWIVGILWFIKTRRAYAQMIRLEEMVFKERALA
jgi:hypothetical protein